MGSADVGEITFPIEFNFEEIREDTYIYTFFDAISRLGGAYVAVRGFFYIFMPFVMLHFLYQLAHIIGEKYKHAYRDGLNDLAVKSFYQLVKIKEMSTKSDDWKFLNSADLVEIDQFLVHATRQKNGEETFRNTRLYSNEHLHDIIDKMIKFIKYIQLSAKSASLSLNIDFEKLNQNKEIEFIQQRAQVDIASKEAAYNTNIRHTIDEYADKGENEDDLDLDKTDNGLKKEQFSAVDIQLGGIRNRLKKKESEFDNMQTFHYRRTQYDIAFAVSITDEILNLEPLEDKLSLLKRKYDSSQPVKIIALLKQRISFFAIFNLFDTVEQNQIDNQANMQKLWLHIKNQETEI